MTVEVAGQVDTPAVVTDQTSVPAVETNHASTSADEFWDGDLENSLSVPGNSTNASNSTSAIGSRGLVQKKVRGRPRLGTSNLKNLPAILRFLTPTQDMPEVIVREDNDSREKVIKRRRIYVVDSSDTDEDSSIQVLDDNHNVQD